MSTSPRRFTGTVTPEALTTPTREAPLAVYAVTFDASAHMNWHTHPLGQGLYVTDGVALVQVEGRPPLRLGTGESIWISAATRHCHGTTPERPMTRLAYQQAGEDPTTVDWHEPVPFLAYDNAAKESC